MALRYKISGAILILLAIALVSLGLMLSHNSPCGAPLRFPAMRSR